jgi:hypothetical protein
MRFEACTTPRSRSEGKRSAQEPRGIMVGEVAESRLASCQAGNGQQAMQPLELVAGFDVEGVEQQDLLLFINVAGWASEGKFVSNYEAGKSRPLWIVNNFVLRCPWDMGSKLKPLHAGNLMTSTSCRWTTWYGSNTRLSMRVKIQGNGVGWDSTQFGKRYICLLEEMACPWRVWKRALVMLGEVFICWDGNGRMCLKAAEQVGKKHSSSGQDMLE